MKSDQTDTADNRRRTCPEWVIRDTLTEFKGTKDMQLWRKALALVLLMVFLPATVLAVMPVELCLGSDGHRAIESSIGGTHHDMAAAGSVDADATMALVELPDCVDISILTIATASVRCSGDQSKLSLLDKMPPAVLSSSVAHISPPVLWWHSGLRSAEAVKTDPFLVAHATDVLLN